MNAPLNAVRARIGTLAVVIAVAATLSGCALALRTPHIADLQRNPTRYYDKTVSVTGTVTDSWGIPLVPFKVYRIDDGTGQLTVVSQNLRTPVRGSRVRVRGKVNEVGVFGGRALGLHIREDSLHVMRGN
jgi:hypothetical protein